MKRLYILGVLLAAALNVNALDYFAGVNGGLPVTANDNYGYSFDSSNGYLSSEVSYANLSSQISAMSSNPYVPEAAKTAAIAQMKAAQSNIKDWSKFREDYKVGFEAGIQHNFGDISIAVPVNFQYSHFHNDIGKCKNAGYKDDAKDEEIVQFVINPNIEIGYDFKLNNFKLTPVAIMGAYSCINTLKSGEADKTLFNIQALVAAGLKVNMFEHYTVLVDYNFIDTSVNVSLRYIF